MIHPEFSADPRGACSIRVSLAIVVLGVFLLVLQATPAVARQARLFMGGFGGASSTIVDPYPLSTPYMVAVDDANHDVYVTDLSNYRVEKFGPAGEFILMFGKEVNLTKVLSAAPEAEQNVCTAASFDTCQGGASTLSPGGFEYVAYVAVDNSSGESKGDVYVADRHGLVSKFDSSGGLISSWGNSVPANGQLNGSNATGTIKGPFGTLGGIAVDTSGNLWVAGGNNGGQMFEFRQDSSFITGWGAQTLTVSESIAVDSEDNLYVGSKEVEKFDSAGKDIGTIGQFQGGNFSRGVAVDPTDDNLYVDVEFFREGNAIQRYGASCRPHREILGETRCTPAESFGSAQLSEAAGGLAVDPSTPADTLYVSNGYGANSEVAVFSVETVPDVSTLKATGFSSTSAKLNGSVNPSGVELEAGLEGCRFEWGETETYGHIAPCDQSAAQIGSGSSPVEVSSTIAGLQQGRTYHFRLVAGNANDVNSVIEEPSQGSDLAFGPPAIESASAIGVAANSATMQAQVNPNNVDTRVRVEYGTEAGVYDHSTQEAELGAGGTSELTPFQLSGLAPRTVYHYRAVAENALGEGTEATLSGDHMFVTQTATAGFALPDGRGWELVSPPDKHGSEIPPISEMGVIQASVTGDAISYMALASTEAEPAGRALETQILSRRAMDSWESQDIALPHETASGITLGFGEEYRSFSSDLSLGVVQPIGFFDQRVSVEASEQTAFLRTNFPSDKVDSPCPVSCYRPLVTGAPGHENVPPGTMFGNCRGNVCGPIFVGASPDLSHVVLKQDAALTEGAPDGSLYEWSNGDLALVSVLPDGQPAPTSTYTPALGEAPVARNAVSLDGSRIAWSDNKEYLYVRDSVREETVQVGSGSVRFQTASSDGSKILFTTEEGQGQSEEHGDLRECDIVESGGELHCEVTDLTPVGAGEDPGVLGVIPGASTDASYVYFVSNAALENNGVVVPGARPGGCGNHAVTGVTCNLYVRHNGTIKLVAELSGEDVPDWSGTLSGLVVRVSPDGRRLEFMSDRSLTGYDNRDSVTGKPDEEVYLYDAVANGDEGLVVCASCDPTGARPHGAEFRFSNGLYIPNVRFEQGQSIAAYVPGWTAYTDAGKDALYQSRYLSDSGRLFFNSSDALVPRDSNGTGDVYEYEPSGVGDCATSSATLSANSGGCVGLISSGTSRDESVFLDAGEDGSDVFFLSSSQLSYGDTDSIGDVYDARVGGGFAEPSLPPVCEGDACQSPVGAPEDPTPGSLSYSGPGNPSGPSSGMVAGKHKARALSRVQKLARALSTCKRVRSKRVRGVCVLRARKRYGNVSAGGATRKKGGR